MTAKFYLVGGAVRDQLLGQNPKDKDYAVECESFDAMRQAIIDRGGKIFLETPQYFTIRAHIPELGATDYVLCRKDGEYTDGRHPESVSVGTIYDDLARRDFTMNAIAIDTDTQTILDPFRGRNDIEAKIVKCVNNPGDRMNEDKLRAFRALRFAVTKKFDLHYSVARAIEDLTPDDFENVSTERIREELLKMFQADTFQSITWIKHFGLIPLIKARGIWLKPTVEKV